jgi:hypothetical protein
MAVCAGGRIESPGKMLNGDPISLCGFSEGYFTRRGATAQSALRMDVAGHVNAGMGARANDAEAR